MSGTSTPNNPDATWHIPWWAMIPIGIAVAAASISNGLRAYGLGAHLEAFTITAYGMHVSIAGAVLVLAAVAVSVSQPRTAWLAMMPGTPTAQRIIAAITASVLVFVSASSLSLHLMEADRNKNGAETGHSTAYKIAKTTYEGLAGQVAALARFGPKKDALPRPREAIQSEINALDIKWGVWTRSKQCTDITKEESDSVCQPVLALYEEQGAYASLILLQPKVDEAKAALGLIPPPAETVSTFETSASFYWAWGIGVALVLLETFGPVIWARRIPFPATATVSKPSLATVSAPETQRQLPAEHKAVVSALKKLNRPVSNDELADAMGVCKGESSKRVSAMNGMVNRVQVGREVRISLAAPH